MTDLLGTLRIDPDNTENDGIPTCGIVIYEAMHDGHHSLAYASSDGASLFHILGLLESAATYLRADLLDLDDT